MKLQAQGRFLLGLPYQDKVYYDFSVHLLTLGGESRALEKLADIGLELTALGSENKSISPEDLTLYELAFWSEQIVIEGIPAEVLTPRYLLEHLTPSDYVLAGGLMETLKKKRSDVGENQAKAEKVAKSPMG